MARTKPISTTVGAMAECLGITDRVLRGLEAAGPAEHPEYEKMWMRLGEFPVKENRRFKSTLGRVDFWGKTGATAWPVVLQLSTKVLKGHHLAENPRDLLAAVFLHEVAHILCGQREGHGPLFREVCRAMGTPIDGRWSTTEKLRSLQLLEVTP